MPNEKMNTYSETAPDGVPIGDLQKQWYDLWTVVNKLPNPERFIAQFAPMLTTFVTNGVGKELCLIQESREQVSVSLHAITTAHAGSTGARSGTR